MALEENEIYLEPKYDNRKSFYKKAKIRTIKGGFVLISYVTEVAKIINGKAIVYSLFSNTTTRHIKEFLHQNSFEVGTSKQIMEKYGLKE